VTFEHTQLDDWILVRTDGTPTYNFCVVVDDVTMRITHVIRGDDHLSNTPKQILCYEALDYAVPEFAHVSLILGKDKSRLSKRHGATSVQAFRDAGFPAEALVNYLALSSWSHGDQEVFSRAELVELFDIKNVATSAAVFDVTKLEWLSQHYLKTMPGSRLAELATPFIRAAGLVPPEDPTRFIGMLDTLRERAKTLVELVEQGRFYFERPSAYEPKAAEAPDRRGRPASRPDDRAPRGGARVHGGRDRADRARAHRRARPEARRSRPARASRRDGPHGIAADLRRAGADRPRRIADAPAPSARDRGTRGVRLLLARHGQSLWNEVRKFQGANDVGLSDLGRTQAAALGSALRSGYRVAAAYVSPMCRARDTAEIALKGTGIPLTAIHELRELARRVRATSMRCLR
jgi:hypothetical protein